MTEVISFIYVNSQPLGARPEKEEDNEIISCTPPPLNVSIFNQRLSSGYCLRRRVEEGDCTSVDHEMCVSCPFNVSAQLPCCRSPRVNLCDRRTLLFALPDSDTFR